MHYYQILFGHVSNYLVSYPFLGLAYMYYQYFFGQVLTSLNSFNLKYFFFIVLENKLNNCIN